MKTNINLQNGTEALNELQKLLEVQHGKESFNLSLQVATLERDLIDSLTKHRKHQKITQKDLAIEIESNHQQISKYERTEQVPSLSAFLKMCGALGLEFTLKSKEDDTVIFHM